MSKRFGKARVPGCECTQSFTCRPCLDTAGPTRGHSQAIVLVNPDGTLTDEGLRLSLSRLTPAQREVLSAQALEQEVYGSSAKGVSPRGTAHSTKGE